MRVRFAVTEGYAYSYVRTWVYIYIYKIYERREKGKMSVFEIQMQASWDEHAFFPDLINAY